MEKTIFVPEEELPRVLAAWAKQAVVWVPVADPEKTEVVRFQPYGPGAELRFDLQSVISAKEVLFPRSEPLLRFTAEKDPSIPAGHRVRLEACRFSTAAIVFGCRPCDARGFLTFDPVFLHGPHRDPYYAERRQHAVIVSLACQSGDAACFCTAVGSGPADRRGSDIMMVPVAGGYLFEAVTGEGAEHLEKIGRPPSAEQRQQAETLLAELAATPVGGEPLKAAPAAFQARFQDEDFWRRHAERCLSCGLCTFLCPTCYCFNITDEAKGLEGERIRSWDACMFAHFTLEASGHNPRHSRLERYRNRVGHKFAYFPKRHGQVACCGCGRCLRHCPVAVDIRAVVRDLNEQEGALVQER